jgi:hypothetical protein
MSAVVTPLPLDEETTIRLLQRRAGRLMDQLDDEMVARARAEADAEDARGLSDDLQKRLAWLETDRDRLLRAQGSRLLPWLVASAAAGIAGGALVLAAGPW